MPEPRGVLEIRLAEVHHTEVGQTEVGAVEIRAGEVGIPIAPRPSVPGINTSPEYFQVFWIGHLGRLPIGRRLAAKNRRGIDSSTVTRNFLLLTHLQLSLGRVTDYEVSFAASGTIIPGDIDELLAQSRGLFVGEVEYHRPVIWGFDYPPRRLGAGLASLVPPVCRARAPPSVVIVTCQHGVSP